MYKYIVYFEDEEGDILPEIVEADNSRSAVLKASKQIDCNGTEFVPVKVDVFNPKDIINYLDLKRSEYAEKVS